jgi:hypothetical protein
MKKLHTLASVLALSAFSAASFAEVPAAATSAFTAVQTDGLALIDAGWPVLTAIVGGFVVIKLFKKIVNKAT